MGSTMYSSERREMKARTMNYATASVDALFTQQSARKIHELMDPKGVRIRESRDSAVHPNTVPIILALDVTGSMLKIPEYLVREGLPKMVGNIIQRGLPDPALLFMAVGDHEVDRCPLQVGQFESGDEELDLWLTRTYLEAGGGGNTGESYLLAWYFAAFHTATDAWEKRGKKGILITTGDEPCLHVLPMTAVREIMGDTAIGQGTYQNTDLLKAAQERWEVYHLNVTHSNQAKKAMQGWKELLGQNAIDVPDYTKIPNIVADLVVQNALITGVSEQVPQTPGISNKEESDQKITL